MPLVKISYSNLNAKLIAANNLEELKDKGNGP
jgi:hypothetical protein